MSNFISFMIKIEIEARAKFYLNMLNNFSFSNINKSESFAFFAVNKNRLFLIIIMW